MLSRNGYSKEEIIDDIIELMKGIDACNRNNKIYPHDKIDTKRLIELTNELIEFVPLPDMK